VDSLEILVILLTIHRPKADSQAEFKVQLLDLSILETPLVLPAEPLQATAAQSEDDLHFIYLLNIFDK